MHFVREASAILALFGIVHTKSSSNLSSNSGEATASGFAKGRKL